MNERVTFSERIKSTLEDDLRTLLRKQIFDEPEEPEKRMQLSRDIIGVLLSYAQVNKRWSAIETEALNENVKYFVGLCCDMTKTSEQLEKQDEAIRKSRVAMLNAMMTNRSNVVEQIKVHREVIETHLNYAMCTNEWEDIDDYVLEVSISNYVLACQHLHKSKS